MKVSALSYNSEYLAEAMGSQDNDWDKQTNMGKTKQVRINFKLE